MKKSSAITPNHLIYNGMMAENFALSRVTNAISNANTIVLGSILNSCELGFKYLLSPLFLICDLSHRALPLKWQGLATKVIESCDLSGRFIKYGLATA